MFKFKKSFFIVSNFILSVLIFTVIFYFRYQWFNFFEVTKRNFSLIIFFHIISYSFVIVVFNIAMKIYELNKISYLKESIIPNLIVSFISMAFFGIIFFFFKLDFARFVFLLGFVIIPFVLSLYNKLIFTIFFKKKRPFKITFLGSALSYNLLQKLFEDYKRIINVEISFVDTSDEKTLCQQIKNSISNIDFIIADTDVKLDTDSAVLLNEYEISGGHIYSLIDMFKYLDQSIPAEIIKTQHFEMFSTYKLDSIYLKFIKRFGDIFISLVLLILTLPITLVTALLVITTPGGIFYTQKRVGYKGKEFTIYKFRSMVKNAEKNGAQLSAKNDARITWIGKIIRMVRIDELPQLINILKGDMSFIGPRPERLEIMNKIVEEVPLFKKRLLVKPGLTGWAQVKYVYANDISGMNKKLSYDLYYINNVDFLFDIKIVLYTFETVIFRRGAM